MIRSPYLLPVILLVSGFILITVGLTRIPLSYISGLTADLLSPISSTGEIHAKNPLYDEVHTKQSSTYFESFSNFPSSLSPVHTELIDIPVKAYAVMDRDSRELLYAKNLTQEFPIASITKVMTALVGLEQAPLDLVCTISSSAATIGEATMGISAGEQYTLSELLYGALLPSGNDAAESIAEGVGKYKKSIPLDAVDGGGARIWFLEEMNRKAQSLGLFDTYFFNPTGLDEDTIEQTSFSTALDLIALADYALQNDTFAQIVNTRGIQLPYEEGKHKALYVGNILQLDRSYPGIKGIKPGNSVYAGETLLSYAERDNMRIIVVILGSNHTRDDVIDIYTTVFGQ